MENENNLIRYNQINDKLDIYYYRNFISNDEATQIFNIFEENLEYYDSEITKVKIRGNYIKIPRKQIAYGEANTKYSFTGTTIDAKNWNNNGIIENILIKIKNKINLLTGKNYNFVLINRYENGKQHIGYHNDDEKDLKIDSDIVGLSLGDERLMSFIKNTDVNKKFEINLENGSLIIIKNPTNKYWKHSIPKMNINVEPRISLTFREMIN